MQIEAGQLPEADLGIRVATPADREGLLDHLARAGLTTLDVLHPDAFYWVAIAQGVVVGSCGLEVDGANGLVRSVAVAQAHRGMGVAEALLQRCLRHAHARGIENLYLFSKDTGTYFLKLGWKEVAVSIAANALRNAPQVQRYDRIGWYPNERAFAWQ